MRRFKYAFVGAGPATLAALNNLSPQDLALSVVLEAGDVKRKICPSLKARNCSKCSQDLCPVLSGVGGASYGFGNKICEFPASDHVAKFATKDELADTRSSISELLSSQEMLSLDNPFSVLTSNPNRKHYQANIALADQYREVLDDILDRVSKTVNLLAKFVVSDIRFINNDFYILSEAGQEIRSENVVLAVGRSGHQLVRRVLPKLDVGVTENCADVGFRIQSKTTNFAEQFFYQNDPKYKFDFGSLGSGRTFCACKGGIIVPVKFGNGYFADGAFVRKPTEVTNVALMARSHVPLSYDALEDWCMSVNDSFNDSLNLGSFDLDAKDDAEVGHAIKELMPRGISYEHDAILERLIDFLVNSNKAKLFKPKSERQGAAEVLGPSIDRYWPKIATDSPLIREGRLTVLGDAAGASRGIFQAFVAGVLWANRVSSGNAFVAKRFTRQRANP